MCGGRGGGRRLFQSNKERRVSAIQKMRSKQADELYTTLMMNNRNKKEHKSEKRRACWWNESQHSAGRPEDEQSGLNVISLCCFLILYSLSLSVTISPRPRLKFAQASGQTRTSADSDFPHVEQTQNLCRAVLVWGNGYDSGYINTMCLQSVLPRHVY